MQHRLLALVLILLPAIAFANDWPGFRGPDGQARAVAKDLPTKWGPGENLAWKVPLPGPGGSSPVVVKDRIYLTCYTGYAIPGEAGGDINALKRHLLCLNRADGKVIWQKTVDAAQPEQAKVRDHGYASSTVAVDADHVYVFFGKSGVFAFKHDGEQAWKADVGNRTHGWGSATSPLLHENLVIINASVESESLIALDRKTGKEIWRTGGIRESWNTPILVTVDGKTEIVLAIQGKVLGLDPANGKQLWSCDTDIRWYMVPSLARDKDVVYCVGGRSNQGLAVRAGGRGDVTGSHRLWKLQRGTNVPSPIFHDGHVYFMHQDSGTAYCVEAASGKVVYEEQIGQRIGQVYASPILADGKIYVASRRGGVAVIAAGPKFQLLGVNAPGDRSSHDASPAAAGSQLFIRSDQFLYCIGR